MRLLPILSIAGFMCMLCGLMMLFPALVDYMYGNWQSAAHFALSSAITVALGLIILMLTDGNQSPLKIKEMFFTTVLIWICYTFLCAFPFYFSSLNISFTNAVFEAVSGLTTTGSTVFTNLDTMPHGILLWRSLTQWMGGIGILVVAILVLPTLRIGGMQLFNIEASGESNRQSPTTMQNMVGLLLYFMFMTGFCGISLYIAGMHGFDAINHAMTAIATGGFSTHDLSIGFYQSPAIEWVLIFFMFTSGLPLMVGIYIVHHHLNQVRQNDQIFLYILFFIGCVLFLSMLRWGDALFDNQTLLNILRSTTFNVISIMTSTGFTIENYELWGTFATAFFMFLMMIGGCTGSTAGGFKMFRISVILKIIRTKMHIASRPHGVFIPRYGKKSITEDVVSGVLVFAGLYFFSIIIGTITLSLFNLDFITSLSGTITALSNIGPGLGQIIGPSSNFATLPDGAKWCLSVLMILGRLEFIAIIILFFPFFWKKNI